VAFNLHQCLKRAILTIQFLNSLTKMSRIGFHYFPDTQHYSQEDLSIWLPELLSLGASWITLIASSKRAIPESFITTLIDAEIEPILHFIEPIEIGFYEKDFRMLLRNYARWGIRYVTVFEKPNCRISWSATSWSQSNLVERFLDAYLPIATYILEENLIPVFPPLQPGGDFWDTAFLRKALEGLKRRGQQSILRNLAIGTYAFAGNKPINWGAGGPESWPGAQPYKSVEGVQDQIGFRIFEWYSTILKETTGKALPIILLRAGCSPGDRNDLSRPALDEDTHASRILEIAKLMEPAINGLQENTVPHEVLACNFWLLATRDDSKYKRDAWFKNESGVLPIVSKFKRWFSEKNQDKSQNNEIQKLKKTINSKGNGKGKKEELFSHYLLLPLYTWGIADWDFELIKPFVEEHHPTIGFSITEASKASRVTIAGNENSFSEDVVELLRDAGCAVQRLRDDGILVAS
jgi:hypothetical protein